MIQYCIKKIMYFFLRAKLVTYKIHSICSRCLLPAGLVFHKIWKFNSSKMFLCLRTF